MNWVKYKLENDSVIEVPYNRCNVAPITKETLEQLINVVNASMRQAKILEHIKTNYADKMREQYEKGRADGIEECKTLLKTSHMIRTTEDDFSAQIEIPFYRKLWKAFEELKEQK